jgi:hypothetical protein
MKFHTVLMVDRNDGRGLVRMQKAPAGLVNQTCMDLVANGQAIRAQLVAMPTQSVLFEAHNVSPKVWAWRSASMATPALENR